MGILRVLLFAAGLPLAAQFPIVIDAAGPGDQYFTPPGTCLAGGTCRTTSAAMGDPPMNTQRFGFNGAPFMYQVPLPNGFYDLALGFAEQSKTKVGQRVFTVTVQGEASAPIDLVKLTGGPNFPYVQTWARVAVRAGMLTIRFDPVLSPSNGQPIGNPVVNALQIQPSAAPTPITTGFVEAVPLGGSVDGVNAVFKLPSVPNPAQSMAVYLNGLYQTQNADYTLMGDTVTMTTAPAAGGHLIASYRVDAASIAVMQCMGSTGTSVITNPDGTTTTLQSACDGLFYVQVFTPGSAPLALIAEPAPPGFFADPAHWIAFP